MDPAPVWRDTEQKQFIVIEMHVDLSPASFSLVFFNNSSHSQFTALEILSKCLREYKENAVVFGFAQMLYPF